MDATVVGWRAWYSEGRRYSSADTEWAALPEEGAQVFVFYHKTRPYRSMRLGDDLYFFTPANGQFGSFLEREAVVVKKSGKRIERLPQALRDAGLVKKGLEIPEREYERYVRQASEAWEAPDESLRVDKVRDKPPTQVVQAGIASMRGEASSPK